jgi:hypothetical protein
MNNSRLVTLEYVDPHRKIAVLIEATRKSLLRKADRGALLAEQSRTVRRMHMLVAEVAALMAGADELKALLDVANSRALVREIELRLIAGGHLRVEAVQLATVQQLDDYRSEYCRQNQR